MTDLRVDIIIPTFNRAHLIDRAVRAALDQSWWNSHVTVIDDGGEDDTQAVLSRHFDDPSFRQFLLKGVKRHGDSYRWTFNLASIIRGYSGLQEAVLGWQPHEGPVLFLRGGESDYVQEEHLVLIRTLFPYAEIETIERAGHWIHADAPKEFGDRVMAFLDRA